MVLAAWAAGLLAACAGGPGRAPVEDRVGVPRASAPPAPAASAPATAEAPKPLPGAENAGKPGYYTVKPGDVLGRVALENGQNWRDIARWNNLENPNVIEVGQVLRVWPPGSDSPAATRPVTPQTPPAVRPLDPRAPAPSASAASAPAGTPGTPASGAVTTPVPPAPQPPAPPRDADDDLSWSWPAVGPVVTPFEDGRTKGLAISGKAGDPVLAAADGRVVYAGSGLRGYGNLVIIKHNNTYLTAYAHNQVLLVKEDQAVRRGQRIAEMGSSESDRVQLHFEVRRGGKPVDPARVLPPR